MNDCIVDMKGLMLWSGERVFGVGGLGGLGCCSDWAMRLASCKVTSATRDMLLASSPCLCSMAMTEWPSSTAYLSIL